MNDDRELSGASVRSWSAGRVGELASAARCNVAGCESDTCGSRFSLYEAYRPPGSKINIYPTTPNLSDPSRGEP